MALDAVDGEPRRDTAAPADLDHLAQALRIGRLADQAGIQRLALFLQPLQHPDRAVDRRAFLVAGDQQADGTVEFATLGQESRDGRDKGADSALHIRRAPAVENAVRDLGPEGRLAPAGRFADRDHVDMAREAEIRRARAEPGIEIVDPVRALSEGQACAGEAHSAEDALQHIERAFIGRRHARAADQLPGQLDRIDGAGHGSILSFARDR